MERPPEGGKELRVPAPYNLLQARYLRSRMSLKGSVRGKWASWKKPAES